MVLNPLSFFIKSLVVVCACVRRQVGSFFGVKFWRKFFDKKNVSFFSSVPAQMTEDPQNTRVWLHDDDDDDAHGTMEREKQKPTTTRGRDETTTTTTTTRDRDATLWSIFFWCSQNQCVSSSSFRSLLLESFSLRFVDVRLCTRDATWSIFVGVTKLFLFVVSLFAF